jgi:hypothetical protein
MVRRLAGWRRGDPTPASRQAHSDTPPLIRRQAYRPRISVAVPMDGKHEKGRWLRKPPARSSGVPVSLAASSDRSSALDHLQDDHDERDHEQDVNESAERVRADHAQQPEHEKDNEESPQHDGSPVWVACEVSGRNGVTGHGDAAIIDS